MSNTNPEAILVLRTGRAYNTATVITVGDYDSLTKRRNSYTLTNPVYSLEIYERAPEGVNYANFGTDGRKIVWHRRERGEAYPELSQTVLSTLHRNALDVLSLKAVAA